MEKSKEIIIFDTEYTTWEGAQERRWLGKHEYKEIIQISAIKVKWPEASTVDTFSVNVKPQINPTLSDYCQKLTSISQDEIDKGIAFQEALKEFLDFCGDRLIISYGNDSNVLAENLILTKSDPLTLYGKFSPAFLNIKYWLRLSGKSISELNSGKLWQAFGNKKHANFTHEHNALSDCYSILQALIYLKQNKHKLPF